MMSDHVEERGPGQAENNLDEIFICNFISHRGVGLPIQETDCPHTELSLSPQSQ